jgi:protein-S-isoprenylcysteine O-methyltransferase Ste14
VATPSSVPEGTPSVWRQLRAIGPLPGIVTVVIPLVLVLIWGTEIGWGLDGAAAALPVLVGAGLIVPGLVLMRETIALFAREGEGTLAPWDPTRKLVVRGPYRWVRNPMITGVGLVLLAEALILGSIAILIEFGVFAFVNVIWMPLVEEPGLVRRFGDDYSEYRRAVPRWVPRRTPWNP